MRIGTSLSDSVFTDTSNAMTTKLSISPIILSLITLFCLLGASRASAQTYRVSAGLSPDGMETFREVFEYDFVDQKPSFPGGQEALLAYVNKSRQYPREAYDKGIEGRVTCSFVVNADGNISHIKVIKGCQKLLNIEAIRILAGMPSWLPGRHAGKCVPVRVIHSIPFRR